MTTGSWNRDNIPGKSWDHGSWDGTNGKYDSSGNLKMNAYSKSVVKAQYGPVWSTYSTPPCGGPGGDGNIYLEYNTSSNGNTDNTALNHLGSKIRGSNNVDLGNFLATGVQAVDQTVSTIVSFGRGLSDLKKGNLAGALRNLGMVAGQRRTHQLNGRLRSGDISGTWLAMQYGWLPTLSDISDLWKAWTSKNDVRRYSYGGGSQSSYSKTGHKTGYDTKESGYYSCHYRYELAETLSVARSLGLYDPVGIAWEVIPYSFVVDWFVPISTYLDNLSMFPYLSGRWCKSTKLMRRLRGTKTNDSYYNCPQNKWSSTIWREEMTFVRTVGSGSISVPPVGFKSLPSALSGAHIRNAIALAHQLILRA